MKAMILNLEVVKIWSGKGEGKEGHQTQSGTEPR